MLAVLSEPRARGCPLLMEPVPTEPAGIQPWGWHVGTRQWKEKRQKEAFKFPLTVRKEDNCIMMDHSWCTFSISPPGCSCSGWNQALPLLVPSAGSPWGAVSWHTTCWSWAGSLLAQTSLAALLQWLLHYHGNCSKTLNCISDQEIVCILESICPYWAVCCLSSSDPNSHCAFDVWWGKNGSWLPAMDINREQKWTHFCRSKQCYVLNLECYTWVEIVSLNTVLQSCAGC